MTTTMVTNSELTMTNTSTELHQKQQPSDVQTTTIDTNAEPTAENSLLLPPPTIQPQQEEQKDNHISDINTASTADDGSASNTAEDQHSLGSDSTGSTGSRSKQSQDLWVQACEQEDPGADSSKHSVDMEIMQEVTSPLSATTTKQEGEQGSPIVNDGDGPMTPPISREEEEEEEEEATSMHSHDNWDPLLETNAATTTGPIVPPISEGEEEEEEATSIHSNDNLDLLQQSSSSTASHPPIMDSDTEKTISADASFIKTDDDDDDEEEDETINQEQQQQKPDPPTAQDMKPDPPSGSPDHQDDDEEDGDCSVTNHDEDSTIFQSDRMMFQNASSSEFLIMTTPQTSNKKKKSKQQAITAEVSERMTASERWRDDAKVQDLPLVSRNPSLHGGVPNTNNNKNKGDFGPPSIPRRIPSRGPQYRNINSEELLPEEEEEEEEEATDVGPAVPKKSILKASIDEEIHVKLHRKYWKKLPPPDMDHIKLTRQQLLDFLKAQTTDEEEEKEEGEERKQDQEQEQVPSADNDDDEAQIKSLLNDYDAIIDNKATEEAQEANAAVNVNGVVFENVYIREHQQTIGDNPSVSYGTPISLDWPYMDNEPLDLDVYEAKKMRRTMRQMFLNHYQRKNILIHKYGHSKAEVKAAKYATNKVRSQRNMSKMMQTTLQPLLVFEEMRESAVRKAKRRMSGGGGGNNNNNASSSSRKSSEEQHRGGSSTGSQSGEFNAAVEE